MKRPLFWGVLALALSLRLAGIDYGLPFLYHNDEPTLVNHAVAIGARGWNTHYFVIAPFVMYVLFILYAAWFTLGRLFGQFPDAQAFALQFFSDPTTFYLIGRAAIGVFFGTATVALVYRLGKRFFSENIGLLAALFLAISPLHVQHSHYIYADIPLTFALTLLLYRLLLLLEDASMKNCLIAGAVLGWALGVKYTAAFILPASLACVFLAFGRDVSKPASAKKIAGTMLSASLAFFVTAPFTFLAWGEFYSQMKAQTPQNQGVGLLHHFQYSFVNGLGWSVLLLAAVGAAWLWSQSRKKAALLLFFFFGFYFVNVPVSQPFARYVMPLVPVLCFWAACGWNALMANVSPAWVRNFLLALLASGMLLPTLCSNALFLEKDTRTQALEWIETNVPAGEVIVLDSRFFGPRLRQVPEQIDDKRSLLQGDARSEALAKSLDLTKEAGIGKTDHRVYTLRPYPEDKLHTLPEQPMIDARWDELEREGADYFISTNGVVVEDFERFKVENASRLRLVAQFTPYRDIAKKNQEDLHASTAAPLLLKELFSRQRLGPRLEIYKVER